MASTLSARPPRTYPVGLTISALGFFIAAIAFMNSFDWLFAFSVFWLFCLVGFVWRSDIPPVLPACLAYQWVFSNAGYYSEITTGFFPGANKPGDYAGALQLSLIGLTGIALGFRLVLSVGAGGIKRMTSKPDSNYDTNRLAVLVVLLFGMTVFFEVLPKQIWFGGAQIIENILILRFVPVFILIYLVGRYGILWVRLWAPVGVVIGAQVLSGFSRFKEVLLYVVVIILFNWRPWDKSRRQVKRNARLYFVIPFAAIVFGWLGILWTGGVKSQWRDVVWADEVNTSPVERLSAFVDITGNAITNPNFDRGIQNLSERVSSGFYYLSLVVQRVPKVLPHEAGELTKSAVINATVPRFLFPDKPNLGGDSWIVRKYAGIWVAGDEMKTSVGLGYMGEFYIDFGASGVFLMCMIWGMLGGLVVHVYARVSPSKEMFYSLVAIALIYYYMSYDGSFIKFLAGLIQQTIIIGGTVFLFGDILQKQVVRKSRRGNGTDSRHD